MSQAQHNADPLVGTTIDGRYEVLRRIGEGGMGVVYQARQISIDRVIAIKMLSSQMAQDPKWVQRFYNEAKACSRLQHPNTIRIFDFGQTRDGKLFMTMEFLSGQSLRQAVAESAPMSGVRVLKILIQCCASLAEAHSVGIIHRDIKPDNVFLLNLAGSPDFVKLLDFSVAKLLQQNEKMRTQAGVVFGTPQYMSPEQGRGMPLDARSDVYALGILAYEMLTGRVPFTDANPMHVLQMHLRQPLPPLPPSVPSGVQEVVRRALEKEPSARYQSAGEMMQHCQQLFTELGAQAAGLRMPSPGGVTRSAGAADKTMLAGQAPDLSALRGGGGAAAQKTMMADLSGGAPAAIPGGPPPAAVPGGPPPAAPPAGPPPGFAGAGPMSSGAPSKTVMLQDSEGVVSFAQRGGAPAMASPASVPRSTPARASAGFWLLCVVTGLAVGIGAYLLVLGLTR